MSSLSSRCSHFEMKLSPPSRHSSCSASDQVHCQPFPSSSSCVSDVLDACDHFQAAELAITLETENSKRARWAASTLSSFVIMSRLLTKSQLTPSLLQFENSARRHNYLGLLYAFFLALARAGKMEGAIQNVRVNIPENVFRNAEPENKRHLLELPSNLFYLSFPEHTLDNRGQDFD